MTGQLRTTLIALAAGIGLGAVLGASLREAGAAASDRQLVKNTARFSTLKKADADLIAVGETAFMNKDAKTAAESISEDFEWWIVGPDGPKQAVKGRETTMKLMAQFFDKASFDSKVYRLGLVGNILVQVEVDKVTRDGAPVETTSLELYEFRDGKRFREWRFQPTRDIRDK
jgi:ketosteroid isomerase-like protein